MPPRARSAASIVVLLGLLVMVIAVGRLAGARAGSSDADDAEARAAGVPNRLRVVNMLDVRVRLSIGEVDPTQWGRTPPDDEPPAGLQAEVIEPHRVAPEVALRPLRIVDGGGDATFTIEVQRDGPPGDRPVLARIPTRSISLEYCSPDECVDGYGWFDWQDAPDPPLDVFRRCVTDERVMGTYVDAAGVTRTVRAVFECNAARFQTTLALFD